MYKRINKEKALDLLSKPGSVLFDVRDKDSYNKGHIESAINITSLNLSDYVKNTDKSAPVLIICYHGNRSQDMAEYFNKQGFEDVYSIDGGYEGWIAE